MTVEDHIRDALDNASFKPLTQAAHVRLALNQLFTRQTRRHAEGDDSGDRFRSGATLALQTRRHAEGDDSGDRFRSGATLALLMPADALRDEPHAAFDVERADAFRRVELVRREREQVAA